MTNDRKVLASFLARVPESLAWYSRRALAAALLGDGSADEFPDFVDLRLAARRLARPGSRLSGAERAEIAAYFFPLLASGAEVPAAPEPPAPAPRPTLSFAALPSRLRGQADGAPLLLSGVVGGTLPLGARLVVLRDGEEISRQPAVAGPWSLPDATPGRRYRVELSDTGLSREHTRALTSPLLAGTLAHGAGASQLAALPLAADNGSTTLRLSFTGTRNRIYVAVPVSRGLVLSVTQPADNDSNITATFTSTAATLSFGDDGSEEYQVLENSDNFIGPFTLDLHLNHGATPNP